MKQDYGTVPLNYRFLLFDLDKFKGVNDRFGHDVGDRALIRVAAVVRGCFRSGDYICRIGGDEFAAILLGVGPENAALIRDKIETINRQLAEEKDGLPPLSISTGVAFGAPGVEVREIYRQADTALYRVKDAGGRGCAFYEVTPAERAGEKPQSAEKKE